MVFKRKGTDEMKVDPKRTKDKHVKSYRSQWITDYMTEDQQRTVASRDTDWTVMLTHMKNETVGETLKMLSNPMHYGLSIDIPKVLRSCKDEIEEDGDEVYWFPEYEGVAHSHQ